MGALAAEPLVPETENATEDEDEYHPPLKTRETQATHNSKNQPTDKRGVSWLVLGVVGCLGFPCSQRCAASIETIEVSVRVWAPESAQE